MEKTFNHIHYKTLNYKLNSDNGYFEKQVQIVGFKKMPNDLKIEESHQTFLKQQGAKLIIRGRIKCGKYSFFSGLRPINSSSVNYEGNNFEFKNGRKINSLMVFVLNETNTELTVYYFNRFYIDNPKERMKFVSEFLKTI